MLLDIDAAFEAAITALGGPIHWVGRSFDPDPNEGHIRVQVGGQDQRPGAIGAPAPNEWNGVLYLIAVEPSGAGKRGSSQRAMQIRDAFPRGLTLVHGAAKVVILGRSIMAPVVKSDVIETPVAITWNAWESPA